MAPEGETPFSISPEELARTATTWAAQGTTVGALDFGGLWGATGASSRTFAAARNCAEPAKAATNSIGSRLSTMAANLRTFNAESQDSDKSAAGKFDALIPR